MPRLNDRGDVIGGGGGSQGSLNYQPYPFTSDGGGQPFTNDQILVQLGASQTLALWAPGSAPVELSPRRGSTWFAAGGGRFLANLGGGLMYGSAGDIPGAAAAGVGRDGTCAYYPSSATGVGLVVIDPDGTRHDYPNVIAKPSPFVVGPGYVIWDGGAVGGPACTPAVANASGTKLCTYRGERWILYWAEGVGVVLQRDGAIEGWILETRPIAFARDLLAREDGIFITWAVTEAEAPDQIVALTLDGAGAGIRYTHLAAGVAPQPPVWRRIAVVDPPVDPPVPPIHFDPPPVPPVPDPPAPPKGPTVDIPNQLATVQRIRASYPTPLGARHAAFLAELALATGMGLLRKPGGTVITMPDGVTVSQDILMDRASSRIFDVLGDGEGAAIPSWGEAGGSPADPARFYAVTGVPPVVDPPKPPPPSTDLSAILARLDAAEAKIDALQRAEADVLDQVHQLDATTVKVGQVPDLSQFARKGDRVEVSGRINFGVNRWGGIISR